jgi:hypothetical protein
MIIRRFPVVSATLQPTGYFLAVRRIASIDHAFAVYDFGGSSGVAFFRFGARSTCLAVSHSASTGALWR